ncbi:hypothetical protein [Alteromonas sp. C1M14]|uniref:hypothetical protein n=1 Tax=Alteromonas sp. C1M14 TaxID=2841567 RepID=UPI001C087BB2|nr:hypothetical protein [Alteromonas sp. C1M14]MBU2979326.1 hypothetical protein [Alteromonas sp. C1M14]
MKQSTVKKPTELSSEQIDMICGAALFFDLGAFFGEVANAHDHIYRTYGRTSMNHYL